MQHSLWDNDSISDSTPEQPETPLNDQPTPEEEPAQEELTDEYIEQRLAEGTLLRRLRADLPEFDEERTQTERHYIAMPNDGPVYHLFAFDDTYAYLEEATPEERDRVWKERAWEKGTDVIHRFIEIGKELMDLHLHYDDAPEYPLEWRWASGVDPSDTANWHVTKMRFNKDKTELVVNEHLTLAGIPPRCFEYVLGNRSALEWVVDQYRITKDERSKIESNPNDPEYIVRHVCRVVHVSMETLRLQDELAVLVPPEMFDQAAEEAMKVKGEISLKDIFQAG